MLGVNVKPTFYGSKLLVVSKPKYRPTSSLVFLKQDTCILVKCTYVHIYIFDNYCYCADTMHERNLLMEQAYPKIRDYCRRKFGLDFQVGRLFYYC